MYEPLLSCFYRFDGLSLIPGNKTAGFTAQIRLDALRTFLVPADDDDRERLMQDIEQRLMHAGLIPVNSLRYLRVMFHEGTAVPRAFVVDPMFGGSLGADPNELSKALTTADPSELWPLIEYTPHNLDQPQQALALVVMVTAWADWATGLALQHQRPHRRD